MANDFFSKMKDTIVKGANTVAGESGKLVERGKIKASVMKLEDQKKSLLMELGNKSVSYTHLWKDKKSCAFSKILKSGPICYGC